MFWDETNETINSDNLYTLQLKRLKKTLIQAKKVPFYQKLLEDAGITTSSIKTLDDLQKNWISGVDIHSVFLQSR